MCMDPLGRAHLNVLEAIQLVAEEVKRHATHDPGVAEAVLARLRDAETQLREAQAGFSRKESWRVIRRVSIEVAVEILQLVIRATATHCNAVSMHLQVHDHAPWHYYSKAAHGKRLVTSRTRPARSRVRLVSFSRGARQARAYPDGLAPHRRRAPRALRCGAGCRARGLRCGPQVARPRD